MRTQTGYGDWWRLVYAFTGVDGRYSIGGLKGGQYKVRFSDPDGHFATVFYDNKADLLSADTIDITPGLVISDVNAVLTGAGAISGTITLSDTLPGGGVSVTAYRYNGVRWEGLRTTMTDANGEYVIGGLLPGTYRLYFLDPSRVRRPEYYDNVSSIISATDISVLTDTVTPNINAVLDLPAEAVADVTTSGGSVTVDPWTGEVTIMMTSGGQADITLFTPVGCGGSDSPADVTLWMGSRSFAMTEMPADSGTYQATVPADDVTSASLIVRWDCGTTPQEKKIGEIILYDPSGSITDAESGNYIKGATVTLYKVPNWLPDTPTEQRNCRTVDTRDGDDWSNEPAATPDLGIPVNPDLDLINNTSEISPTINPQVTDANGKYGWDVAQGCWYVAVQAEGYETRLSPVVGVPPEVTDLDLALTLAAIAAPSADFTAVPLSGTVPLTVTFTDVSTGDVNAWLWNLGDGTMSTDQHPTHTYTRTGSFTVSLTVSGAGGGDTVIKTGYIKVLHQAPVADFSATPISGSVPLFVQFTDDSSGVITSWQWAFGDGDVSSLQSPSHTYQDARVYTVTLSVVGPGGGDQMVKSRYVTVNEKIYRLYLPLVTKSW